MLSSFFSKSKPINYIAVALYMTLFFSIAHNKRDFEVDSGYFFLKVLSLFIYILPMLVLNFVAQKNDLTNKGTFTILLYAFLTAIFPRALIDFPVLLSNVFVLMALQNILRMRNEKHIKASIFNASIYIALASLAYFWSIGFLFFVFLGVFYFEPKNYRNWIIPCIGIIMVYVFANCITLIFYDSFFSLRSHIKPFSFSFQNYLVKDHFFSVGILLICIVFFFSIYLLKFGRKAAKNKPIVRIIIVYLILAIGVGVIAPEKNTSELFFITPPLALIGTTYLEMDYRLFVKEINIWVFILLPFILMFL
ncbi:DUF6427 family protein [Aquimarina muelleri]|uniref:Uncharacterized protein n=1 Tax=Aquimarina muelleri TaxID=279356 RepID=A0A918JY98_9FLAO|nr:DUF6427 family protein [Aquimarina muelleri]MCX2764298.1 DUF6427 family protein [Aquimarina muelleri]GGX32132.1 hypothetical protein GCM10007384_36320 [Aquimarina muelleri]